MLPESRLLPKLMAAIRENYGLHRIILFISLRDSNQHYATHLRDILEIT